MLKIYNSLTGKTEEFIPIDENRIKVYVCGITVYDRAHLGHAKTYVSCDILIRLLRHLYKEVVYVRNITDVDDKINNRAIERGISIQELSKEMIRYCDSDLSYLGNLKPDIEPRATEHITDIIEMIERLINNGFAYICDGHVLFSVKKYKEYGALSNKVLDDLIAGARIETQNYKRDPLDFVLWKPSLPNDDQSSIFKSPWSDGRPGWHIECSAMSTKYLGSDFDIHCGGADLKFPHHENEIAQSRSAYPGSKFAHYWFHTGFLLVDREKMSKSLGNFVTIQEMRDKGINGKVIRYAMLRTHYSKPLNFTQDIINEANKTLKNLHKNIIEIEVPLNEVPDQIIEALCDDLNLSKAISLLNDFNKNKQFKELKESLIFLGLYDENINSVNIDLSDIDLSERQILELIRERKLAKTAKNWKRCDEIRDFLSLHHIKLLDSKDDTNWEFSE